jgi:hypothetical protein
MFEGPVSGAVVEASSFNKQSIFMIVQTFFVSALAGGLMEGVKDIVNDPLSAIDLLARTVSLINMRRVSISLSTTMGNSLGVPSAI